MDPLRRTALIAGVLYLLTFVSISTLALYGAVHDRNYILGPGPDTAVLVGGISEIIVALAGVGTAVALYPVLKRQNEGVALGLVGSRVLVGAGILAGVAYLLAIVSLRQVGAGALITGQTLAILYDRIFHLSQGLMPAVNDLLLGSCCTSRGWWHGFFPGSHSSEHRCSSFPGAVCCSAFGGKGPR
jgi:hypothetical protein